MKDSSESALIDGIRKTIFRFRTRPLNYFTESDIHSSLMKDVLDGNSDLLLQNLDKIHSQISLIHNEYPTNFRYKKSDLMDYSKQSNRTNWSNLVEKTNLFKEIGDRGNYDLSLLNSEFVKRIHKSPIVIGKKTKNNPVFPEMEIVKHIINKDIEYPLARYKKDEEGFRSELSYAVEVKFIHPFNARNSNMLSEVIKDNSKLKLAKSHTNNSLKAINLVFCSSQAKKRNNKTDPVIDKVENYVSKRTIKNYENEQFVIPNGIINVFITSFFDGETKNTPKPIISLNKNASDNDQELAKELAKELHTELTEV